MFLFTIGIMHRGSQFQLEEGLKDDTFNIRTAVDDVFDNLKKSSLLKCGASYMTTAGEAKGTLIITPFYLIFDPEFAAENRKLIRVSFYVSVESFRCVNISMLY